MGELCTKMAEFDAKKYAEFSGKGDNKKEKKEKAPKQEAKKPEKKKEEKKVEAEEPAAAPVEKKPDPFEKMTTRTTPSGGEITNTMTSSQWSSCPEISSEACSSVLTNSTRMLSRPFVCLARITTRLSPESGYSRVTSSHSSWMTTGRLTTPATHGGNWRASQMRPRNWSINTGSGRAPMRKEGNSTREKS